MTVEEPPPMRYQVDTSFTGLEALLNPERVPERIDIHLSSALNHQDMLRMYSAFPDLPTNCYCRFGVSDGLELGAKGFWTRLEHGGSPLMHVEQKTIHIDYARLVGLVGNPAGKAILKAVSPYIHRDSTITYSE